MILNINIMVKAIVDLDKEANRILNILKAKYGLRDKSEAISRMAREFKELVLEAEIRHEYMRKWRKIQKERIIRVGKIKDFKKRYRLK
jgi:hypothetical protein